MPRESVVVGAASRLGLSGVEREQRVLGDDDAASESHSGKNPFANQAVKKRHADAEAFRGLNSREIPRGRRNARGRWQTRKVALEHVEIVHADLDRRGTV